MLTASEIKNRRKLQASLKLFGITQKQIAQKVGLSESMVSYLFSGKKNSPKYSEIVSFIKEKANVIRGLGAN